jgi:hypothetical protein
MAQQQRLIQVPLIGALILGVLIGVYLFAWKWFAKSEHEPEVVKHKMDTSSEDVLKYWTAEKMRKAKPAPMPHVDNEPDQGKHDAPRAPHPPKV